MKRRLFTSVSIVIPTLNEEEAITRCIGEIPWEELREGGEEPELLVVDGGSTDRTVALARKSGAKVLHSRTGYGRQYQLGFRHAGGDVIVTGDGDRSYPFSDIPRVLEELRRKDLDFVSVNRFTGLSPGSMPCWNRIGNRLLTIAVNFLFGLHLTDSQSGMWVFRKKALRRLRLTSQGMSFSEEIKIEAFRRLRAAEIPGSYRPRIGRSKLRPLQDGTGNIFFLVRKRLQDLGRRPPSQWNAPA